MKIPKIAEAMGEIDADLVSASAKERRAAKQPWIKWSILTAACLCVLIVAGMIVVPMKMGGEDILPGENREIVSFGDLERNYKKQDAVGQELAIEWADKYLSPFEKHWSILWAFRNYVSSDVMVQPEHLGKKLGNYLEFEIRSIQNMPTEYAIALGYQGQYYTYRCRDALDDIPVTLGELFDRYNLARVLEFNHFSTVENKHKTTGYYALTDDAYIIEVLASCRDAKLYVAKDGKEWEQSKEYLSFTMTSDALGVYKRAMYITEDGYLWTNVFEYAYIYEIGTEAANKIIDYAMTNSVEKPMEPYEYRLAGTLTKIEDGYAYIDDSIMCVDPDEGMVFRVSTDDIRIARWLETFVQVGDFVVVTFRGGIDLENGNLILDARSIEEAYFSDGDWYVPE
ncbi:MAG: hypothetical protein IIX86_04330 [Clostridia bacterium]|nr:hypothetical protein [Clostridia bacterium]